MNKTTEALKLSEEAKVIEKMQQDEIIRMAREVWGERAVLPFNELERFAALVAAHEREKQAEQEPVAVISESAIGLVKLHSNGACLPFGTPLYAAPVDAKAIRAEALEEAIKIVDNVLGRQNAVSAAIRGLK